MPNSNISSLNVLSKCVETFIPSIQMCHSNHMRELTVMIHAVGIRGRPSHSSWAAPSRPRANSLHL